MRLFRCTFLFAMGIFILTACNYFVAVQPTQDPYLNQTLDSVRTEAVQTAEFELTERAIATLTISSPTQPATETATKTATDIPPTPNPSATPTELPNTPTATATATKIPPTPTATISPTSTAVVEKSGISFLGVEKDRAVRVLASRFPPDQIFTIRVGPFHDFYVNNVSVGTVYSGAGGSFEFTILLPIETLFAEMITVRLDSPQKSYAYNAFKNQDSGRVIYGDLLISNTLCNVSVSPDHTKTVAPLENFDVVWTIKNISDQIWNIDEVDYKWLSGVEMQIYSKVFDIPQTVQPDETIILTVDILAPDTAGTYTTQWALVNDRVILCHLPLTVNVK